MFEINEVLTIPSVSNGAQPQFRLFLFQNIQCGVNGENGEGQNGD